MKPLFTDNTGLDHVEKYMREIVGTRPMEKYQTKYGELCIADGFIAKPMQDFPWGHFKTAWVLKRDDKPICAGGYCFDGLHDPDQEWDQDTKRKARINACRQEAEDFIESYLNG